MELNALSRWGSISRDLHAYNEVTRLKAQSKSVDRWRDERESQRTAIEESIAEAEGQATPSSSRVALTDLEREEAEILARWRALRRKGKQLRISEDLLEKRILDGAEGDEDAVDDFPKAHHVPVYVLYRVLRRFGKGFLFGYCGKLAFGLIGLLLRHKLNLPKLLPEVAKLLLQPELFRYGGFLGSFLMLFESCMRVISIKGWINKQTLTRHHRSARVLLSAVVASSVAINFLPHNVRLGISMFFLVRALEIFVRWLVEAQEKHYIAAAEKEPHALNPKLTAADNGTVACIAPPSPAASIDDDERAPLSPLGKLRRSSKAMLVRVAQVPASAHFDTLVMAVASAQVIWAWLFNRSTVEPGYLHFLDVQGGYPACTRAGYVDLHIGERIIPPARLEQINGLRIADGLGPLDLSQKLPDLMCSVIHRQTASCTHATLDYFRGAFLRALPVYLPVYGIPLLIFKHRALLKRPLEVLLPTASNLLRSTLFLSSYCTFAWSTACACTKLGIYSQLVGAIAGAAGGLMVAIEKKGRRVELALYVLSQSLPSTWRTLHQRGLVPILPHGAELCFLVSMACIMWSYVTRPHLMRSSYLTLFKFFFGSGGRSAGFSNRAVEHARASTIYSSVQAMRHEPAVPDPSCATPASPTMMHDHPHLQLDPGATEGAGGSYDATPSVDSQFDDTSSASSASSLGSLHHRMPHRLSTVPDGAEDSSEESEDTPPTSSASS